MSTAAPVVPFDRPLIGPEAGIPEPVGQLAIAFANLLAVHTSLARSGSSVEELLTFDQVGKVLQCSEKAARRWVEAHCKVVSVGSLPRVRRADLDASIRRLALPYGDRA